MEKLLQFIGRIDSLPMKRRKKIIWKLKKMFCAEDKDFEIDFYGLKYRGNTGNQIDKYVFYFGAYEKGLLNFIEKTLNKSTSKVFVDIGANIGHHSIFASRVANQVFSFEPYESVRKEMENKISMNNIQNIVVVPFALGEEDQELTYYEPENKNTGTGSFVENYSTVNKNTGLKLTVKNGERAFEELGIKNISLIKVDTEGFEPNILSGLLNKLEADLPTIIMEYSHTSKESFKSRPALVNFFKNNYDLYIFSNPNELNYKLLPWNFDTLGNIVLVPKAIH
jgi:FkbM family methyltransferase